MVLAASLRLPRTRGGRVELLRFKRLLAYANAKRVCCSPRWGGGRPQQDTEGPAPPPPLSPFSLSTGGARENLASRPPAPFSLALPGPRRAGAPKLRPASRWLGPGNGGAKSRQRQRVRASRPLYASPAVARLLRRKSPPPRSVGSRPLYASLALGRPLRRHAAGLGPRACPACRRRRALAGLGSALAPQRGGPLAASPPPPPFGTPPPSCRRLSAKPRPIHGVVCYNPPCSSRVPC